MSISKKRKENIEMFLAEFESYAPAGETLRTARRCLGISRRRLAVRMGIRNSVLTKYENGSLRIPSSMMLKIFMFGLDFWCERDL